MPKPMRTWRVTLAELLEDEDFAEVAEDFGDYAGAVFEEEVKMVADRIHAVHQDREVAGCFTFGFDAVSVDTGVDGATVGLHLPGTVGLYLVRWLELKRLTDDREATGLQQAEAIRSALMDAYQEARELAERKGLLT